MISLLLRHAIALDVWSFEHACLCHGCGHHTSECFEFIVTLLELLIPIVAILIIIMVSILVFQLDLGDAT